MTNKIYMVMGVSGSGKTTIGKLLAKKLNIEFLDGDDFHPETNKQKMGEGIPLTDSDRFGWLKMINEMAQEALQNKRSLVFACSALKRIYRNILSENIVQSIEWIYLKGNKYLIEKRIQERTGHFMPTSLLQSQFDILEEPSDGIVIDTELNPTLIIQQIMEKINMASLGIVGLGVMGKSLARNFARNGIKLSLFNRRVAGTEEEVALKYIASYPELENANGFEDIQSFVNSLIQPRKIFLMIKAGKETDTFIDELLKFLDVGDIVMDGGNSHYMDTKRRIEYLAAKQIHFIGTGVSGGELGALNGPSIMPSGNLEAYKQVEAYLCAIAAKDIKGRECCSYIGIDGSGHFVKMVHNGIEYAEMQLIAEVYAHMRFVVGLDPVEISSYFLQWNKSNLSSYLLEITAQILLKKEKDAYLIDLILDVAGNKGTGNWATVSATELGIPASMITSALFARYLSTIKETIQNLKNSQQTIYESSIITINQIKDAYTLARLVNHQQGFLLLKSASEAYKWNLNLSEIARLWTNGCIIRSSLMENLIQILQINNELFENEIIIQSIENLKPALKHFCICAIQSDLSIPSHSTALEYLSVLSAKYATANIIQAQRDFFGAHTYQKNEDISGAYYHTQW